MSVVTGALGSLGPKLLQLLHGEYKLQKGVRKQVQWLSDELFSIYAFLGEVEKVPWDQLNGQVKVWTREVREASYDMEDVLDTYLVRVDGAEPTDPSRLKRAMRKMGKVFSKAKARRSIAGSIKDIKEHLEEIAQRRQKYKIDEIIMSKPVTATSTIDPNLTAMYKDLTQLIGVNNSRDKLISMLNQPQSNDDAPDKKMTKKVSIVGVGGLGKTTLARVVYENIKSEYDCAAFVSVGRDLELAKVFKDILYGLDKEKYKNIHNTAIGEKHLIGEIKEYLEKKRYFVVVDDVWDVPTWEAIKLSLVENNCGSKVVTTTRKFDVANEAGDVYVLKALSDDDSILLFDKRIFGTKGKYFDNQPEDVIKKILKKCGGIPLAIITMASLLAGKPDYEWSEVLDSIGFGSRGNREAEKTMTILSFSYYDLPVHLRTCLLYLSTYPEDYEIKKDSLIWKWVAEGFIDGKQGTRLFEVGERYFNDLINRCLIQVTENNQDGSDTGCRVHDMVLDLMRELSSEENFIAILDDNVAHSNVRRLAHQNRIAEHINSEAMVTGMPKVRSYTAFKCSIDSRDKFLRFKLLRVLDIVGCNFKEGCHLEHLCDLLHLRYLGITCSGHLELPEEIGNLKLLQTLHVLLHVFGTLPASIVQLTKLVRLCAEQEKAPDGIGNLTSLEELRIRIRGDSETKRFMKELGSLQEMRVLRFSTGGMDESTQRNFVMSLFNLNKIQHIHLDGVASHADTAVWEAAGFVLPRSLCYLDLFVYFSKLPSCINPSVLPILSHLVVLVTTMDEQDLKNLARLPSLCYLALWTRSTVTVSNINAGDGCFFQNLRHFSVSGMVQFEPQQNEDTSISFHMWNGKGDMPFGSGKNSDYINDVGSCLMPNVETLMFWVSLRALNVNNGGCRNFGLKYLPSLRKVAGSYGYDGMSAEEVNAALDVLRDECNGHPNSPTLKIDRSPWDELKERNISKKEDEEHQEEADETSQTADIDMGKLSLSSS